MFDKLIDRIADRVIARLDQREAARRLRSGRARRAEALRELRATSEQIHRLSKDFAERNARNLLRELDEIPMTLVKTNADGTVRLIRAAGATQAD